MASSRREFLFAGGAAPLALALSQQTGNRELTSEEQANVDVVNDFCAAWETSDPGKISSYFADDATFRFTQEGEALTGRETLRQQLAGLADGSQKVVFEVLETWSVGPLVVNLRVDYITNADMEETSFRVAGVFYVKDGKITEWIDAIAPA